MINRKNILNLRQRRDIYRFIYDNPGFHLSEISKRTNIPKTTLLHHMKFLEKQELIISKKLKGFTFYYASNILGKRDKEILTFLRQRTSRFILIILILYAACSQIELCERLEKSPKAIAYHLNKLVKADIIEVAPIRNGVVQRLVSHNIVLRKPVGREIIYRYKSSEVIRSIYNLLLTNENSFEDPLNPIGLFDDFKEHLKYKENPYYKMLSYKDQIDAVSDVVFEIFPHPYHA